MDNSVTSLIQLGFGAVITAMALISLSRPAVPSPPAPSTAHHQPHHPAAASSSSPSLQPDEAAEETPSWISREPLARVDELLEQPSWKASSSSFTPPAKRAAAAAITPPPQANGHHRHEHQHSAADDEAIPSWMSEKPSFVGEYNDEPDELPSWMSRSMVATPIKPVFKQAHVAALPPTLQTANQAVSALAHSRASSVYVYPVLSEGYLGEPLKDKATLCDTRAGAGGVAAGLADKGVECALLCSSLSLAALAPALASARAPLVVHCAACAEADLRLDYTQALSLREHGAVVVLASNGTVKDALECATLAHDLAGKLGRPVVHIMDGSARALNRLEEVQHTAARPPATLTNGHHHHHHHHPEDVLALMHPSAPFDFSGSHTARTLVVSMGPSSRVCVHAVHGQAHLAAVRVRLLDPWLDEELLAQVPRSVRRVVVVDETRDGALFGLVARTLRSAGRQLAVAKLGPSVRGLTLAMARGLLEEAAGGEHLAAHLEIPLHRFAVCSGKTAVWFVPGRGKLAHAALTAAAEVLGMHHPSVSALYDAHADVAALELRMDGAPAWACDVGEADAVVLHSRAVPATDAVAALKDGGVFILVGSESDLPAPLRRRLHLKAARVLLCKDGDEPALVLAGLHALSAAVFHAGLSAVQQVVRRHEPALAHVALMAKLDALGAAPALLLPSPAKVPRGWDGDTISLSGSQHEAGGDEADSFFGLVPRIEVSRADDGDKDVNTQVHAIPSHAVAWSLLYKDVFETSTQLRPREHDTFQVRLSVNRRLTPLEYDRNIFHLEFDTSGTGLTYQIGDALGVFGHNDASEVEAFMHMYRSTGGACDAEAFVGFTLPDGRDELVSVRNLLTQHLDLFGKPTKKFYVWLAGFAKSRYEHLKLLHAGTDDTEAFKLGVAETLTYADLLEAHKSARPSIHELAKAIPSIKARHYSIASSMKMTPRSVHLLVVEVDWKTPSGRVRHGQCTRYLAGLKPDALVTVDVMPSVLRLPPSPTQPIFMAGLGTGMAPFRAFVQERKFQKESGMQVGPVVLYFGARHRHEEYLYGDEWDTYAAEGLVQLRLAFSRDQKDKVYIQHKIQEDGPMLKKYLAGAGGYFYLCGPTWPVPDVTNAVASGIDERFTATGDTSSVDRLKEDGRFILEVY